MIRLFEMFSGYGGASFGLKKANIDFECIGISEIDKYAVQCFDNNFPNITNYGDCTKINPNGLPDFDLLTGGFPCQSFSLAGKRKGINDSRGTLFYDIIRIAQAKKPKYMLLENVKGLLSIDNGNTFKEMIKELKNIGYDIIYKVLNSKDFGIPQSRERIWFVCKLGSWEFMEFQFPLEEELKIFIKDILEENVDKKYYLSEKLQIRFKKYLEDKQIIAMRKAERNIPKELRKYDGQQLEQRNDGCSNTISTIQKDNLIITGQQAHQSIKTDGTSNCLPTAMGDGGGHIPIVYDACSVQLANKNRGKIPYNPNDRELTFDINKEPISYTVKSAQHEFLVYDRKGFDSRTKGFRESELSPTLSQKMGTGGNNVPMIVSPTITCELAHQHGRTFDEKMFYNLTGELRRLTPKECFRLMGFLNDEINLDKLSDTQRYKLAGNGWEINIASKIFKELFKNVERKQ
jgi:DNA (cytosine-5)-methyltransferase 1